MIHQLFLADALLLALAYGVLAAWQLGRLGDRTLWAVTGIGIALGYFTRTAAMAIIVALIPAICVLFRQRRWQQVVAVGFPLLISALVWRHLQTAGGGFGYGAAWRGFVDDLGGWPGYLALQRSNWLSSLFTENLFLHGVFELPNYLLNGLKGRGGIVGQAGVALSVIGFLTSAGLAGLGLWRQRSRLHLTLGILCLANLGQTLLQPWPVTTSSTRYLAAMTPILLFWIVAALRSVPTWKTPVMLALALANCLFNLREISRQRQHWEREYRDLEEVSDWIQAHTPSQTAIGMTITLPYWTLAKLTHREIIDDYLAPADSTSPLLHFARERNPPEYVVALAAGKPDRAPQEVLEPVFLTRSGRYRVLRVDVAKARRVDWDRLLPMRAE